MERCVPNFSDDDARETARLNNALVAKSRISVDPWNTTLHFPQTKLQRAFRMKQPPDALGRTEAILISIPSKEFYRQMRIRFEKRDNVN